MSSKCENRNPLLRSGVNQYQRVLSALLPTHAVLDERDEADLIVFARNYAKQLKYFNFENEEDGTWEEMMSLDVSVTLAGLVKINVPDLSVGLKILFNILKSASSSEDDLKNNLKLLFDIAFTLTSNLNNYYNDLPHDFPFREVVANSIHSELPEYYDRLKKYYQQAVSEGIVDPSSIVSAAKFPFDVLPAQDFDESALKPIWFDSSLTVFTPAYHGLNTSVKIKNISSHNLFTGIFDQYMKVLSKLVEQASLHLNNTLSNFPTHSPHYGLFLVFIKLFRYVKEEGNRFTKRHLDLYYKEILKLKHRDSEADTAHVVFELMKGVDQHLMKAGTVFKAGKDASGNELYYGLTDDIVLNRGVVKSIMSTLAVRNEDSVVLLANSVANSEDGQGAKISSADKSWKVFGDEHRQGAKVGFVIASLSLFLTGGNRTITFKFFGTAGSLTGVTASEIASCLKLQLSGKKSWVDVHIATENVTISTSSDNFTIKVKLDGGEPSIVPYTSKLHQHNFTTSLPVAKFELIDAWAKAALWNFPLHKVAIEVKVEGLKDIVIQNDTGNLSASKPFDMFGSDTHIGSSFIIGSKEIFVKSISPARDLKVTAHVTWDNYTDLISKISSEDTHRVSISYLEDSQWKSAKTNVKLFQDTATDLDYINPSVVFPFLYTPLVAAGDPSSTSDPIYDLTSLYGPLIYSFKFLKGSSALSFQLPPVDFPLDYSANAHYTVQSTSGFIKVQLDTDLGHSTYAQRLAAEAKKAVITSITSGSETTTSIAINDVPEPYTPKVKEIYLDYEASVDIDFSSAGYGSIHHLTPFGSKEVFSTDQLLMNVESEGELFIGIDNCDTDQTLSVLFQVADGTADPLAEKQKINWSFLGDKNEWIEFREEDVMDSTNHLTESGIIRFTISNSAANECTVVPSRLHWIRGTVSEQSASVCKLIDLLAQAASVRLTDYRNTGVHFKSILPEMTISKLVVSDAAVKKIHQPFSSFGGRRREEDDYFYTRVSERLRHKDRGISVWDYERIVLEAYPEIYKVKCISHAEIVEEKLGSKTVYFDNELKPGHVLVVLIPDLRNRNAHDPLRPYTDLGLMQRVKKYLSQHISPHVRLDVRNAKFEEIQLEFKVRYVTSDNQFYTSELRRELEQFLAPWAYDHESDIEFGGKIHKSVLIDFIEERPYVDHLSCVKMYCIVDGQRSGDREEVTASSARSVLVSVKSDDTFNAHRISIAEDKCNC